MADLDFEELDRAINELYESVDDDVERPAEEPVRPEPATESIAEHKTAAKPARRPKKSIDMVARPAKTASPKAAAGGHFMDMVNPSGDVTLQHKPNYAAERQAKIKIVPTVEEDEEPAKPTKIAVVAPEPVDKPDAPAKATPAPAKPAATPTVRQQEAAVTGRRARQFDQPAKRHKPLASMPVTDLRPISKEDIEAAKTDPYQVPFLPDAHVEKRPLGQLTRGSARPSDKTPRDRSDEDHDELDRLNELDDLVKLDDDQKSVEQPGRRRSQVKAKSTATDREKPEADEPEFQPSRQGKMIKPSKRDKRQSETKYAVAHATRNYGYEPRKDHSKGLNILKWIVIFILVVLAGGLAGIGLYYIGGM